MVGEHFVLDMRCIGSGNKCDEIDDIDLISTHLAG